MNMLMCGKPSGSPDELQVTKEGFSEQEREDRHEEMIAKEAESDRVAGAPDEKKKPEDDEDTLPTIPLPDDPAYEIIRGILLTDLWKDSKTEVKEALKTLVKILDSEENFTGKLETFCQYDGPYAVVGVMRHCYDNGSIQAAGTKVFAVATNLQDFVSESSPLWVNGGLEAIVDAMRRFPSREDIQRPGCCVLSRFCSVEENAVYVVNRDGIKAVTEAMKHFPESVGVQQWSCWALYSIARYEEHKKAIVEAGGFGLLAFAAGTFQHESFSEACHITLRRLMKVRQAEEESNLTTSSSPLNSSLERQDAAFLEVSKLAPSR